MANFEMKHHNFAEIGNTGLGMRVGSRLSEFEVKELHLLHTGKPEMKKNLDPVLKPSLVCVRTICSLVPKALSTKYRSIYIYP